MDRGSGVKRLVEDCVWTRKLRTCWATVPLKSSCKQMCFDGQASCARLSTMYLHIYTRKDSAVLSYMDGKLYLHRNTVILKPLPRCVVYCIFIAVFLSS